MQVPVKEYTVGRCKLLLPADHALDRYQTQWKRYDRALGEIARIVRGKYPGCVAVDIGANVGDSAALINTYEDVPTLCIEGGGNFLPFLEENARRMGSHIAAFHIPACFHGSPYRRTSSSERETRIVWRLRRRWPLL